MKLTDYNNPVYRLSEHCRQVKVCTLLELCEDDTLGQPAYDALVANETPSIGDWIAVFDSKEDAVEDARVTLKSTPQSRRPSQAFRRKVAKAILAQWGDEFPAPTPVLSDLLAACKAATTERSIALRCQQTAIDAVFAYHADRVAAAHGVYAAAFAALAEFESGKV